MTATYHHLQVVSAEGETPYLRLVCTAPPDATCRRRPVDPDLESWTDEDETTPGHECWAQDWIENDGWDSVVSETGGILSSVDVRVFYDEGPAIVPITTPEPDQEEQ